jgi:PilZ domain-containing protein
MRWFAKKNRRATPRYRYDGNNSWIRPEGSLTRPCRVLDLSRTGVRLAVTNPYSLPDIFTLLLSKNSSGGCYSACVKWRRGTEVGAEFFETHSSSVSHSTADAPRANPSSASRLTVNTPRVNSSSASRLTADAPSVNSYSTSRLIADATSTNSFSASRLTSDPHRSVKPPGEGEKSANPMSTSSLHSRAQQPDVAKQSARQAVDGISTDKAKVEGHHPLSSIGGQVDRSDQEKDSQKRLDLSRLEKKLGPDHIGLIHALKDVDPDSPHGRELASIIKGLDKTSDQQCFAA